MAPYMISYGGALSAPPGPGCEFQIPVLVGLRKVLKSGDFLQIHYDTPVLIFPDVTLNVANHVVDMVITGNTSGSDPEVIEEVEDTLEMLQISRNFELIENVNGVSK